MLITLMSQKINLGDQIILSGCKPQTVKSIELIYYDESIFVIVKTMGGNCFPIKSDKLVCVNR